jgi:hypothetical protein
MHESMNKYISERIIERVFPKKHAPTFDNTYMRFVILEMLENVKFIQEPLNQRTYHADDFVLAPIVVVITH